jgi:hypothetical protein
MKDILEVLGLSDSVRWGVRVTAWIAGAFISLAGCVIDVVGINEGHGGGEVEVSAVFQRLVLLDDQIALKVTGVNGSINVLGIPGSNELKVTAVRRVRSHSRADAEEHLPLLQISVQARASEVDVETLQPSNSGDRTYQVDYEISIPVDMEVMLVNGNGAVEAGPLNADVGVMSGNGDVALTDITGSASVALGNGRVTSRIHLPVGGQIMHSVGNGQVNLTVQPQVSAKVVAKVGNGSISLVGLHLQQANSEPGFLQGILGGGAGAVDLSLGNGRIEIRGG